MCVHNCDTAVNEKRLHGLTGTNRSTAVKGKKSSTAVYTEKVNMAVYTEEMRTRPCTHYVHLLSSVRLHIPACTLKSDMNY